MEKMFHIQLDNNFGAKYALLTGDPGRVEKIANQLDTPRFIASNREFTTYLGYIGGEPVLVTSTGIGGPSAAIAVEELFKVGVRNFIRIGTCGGINTKVCAGDVVIANACVKMDGTSKEYIPEEYPCVSDFELTGALVQAAGQLGYRYHVGVVQSKDSFYSQHEPETKPVVYELENKWNALIKCGCLASEMEASSIYAVATALGAKASCVLHAIWNKDREKQGHEIRTDMDTSCAIKTAIEAVSLLIKR